MSDVLTAAEVYKDIGVSGVCLIVAIVLVYKLYPYFVDYLRAAKNAKDKRAEGDISRAQAESERNEILRANGEAVRMSSEVIKNNTAVLQMVSDERELTREAIREHEKCSQERDLRNEAQNDDIQRELGKARGDIGELKVYVKERTK